MTDIQLFGFGIPPEPNQEYKLKFTTHYLVGGNTARQDGGWSTKEEALQAFAEQFAEVTANTEGKFLFIRRAPKLVQESDFDGTVTYKMIGRFTMGETE